MFRKCVRLAVLTCSGSEQNRLRARARRMKEGADLGAGEEELLAAVVGPGDDLAAVQAHLRSRPTRKNIRNR
jgi:hypothetical protein